MEAILKFNLETEREEFETAVHARDYKCALSDILEELRRARKYQETTEEQAKIITAIEKATYDILEAWEVRL